MYLLADSKSNFPVTQISTSRAANLVMVNFFSKN